MDNFDSELFDDVAGLTEPTYAFLSYQTEPKPGIVKRTVNASVLLFTTDGDYERLVKDRLRAAGKNPDDFVIGQRAFGERVGHSPVIKHNGENYLQFAVINPGESLYFRETPGKSRPVDPKDYGIREKPSVSGVDVRTVKFSNIVGLELLGAIQG